MQRSELKLFVCLLCFPSPRYDVLWRVTGTFFQKTISAGQIIYALLIRLRITFTKQFLIGLGVGGLG
jgi:hypothetical protein